MGCGRVGATLAANLTEYGHSVAVIDHSPDSFRRLPEGFSGQRVTGMGFDREALIQAGIEDAHGFAAVSSGDNSNIIAAPVVRETFGVSNVVTRIYDPTRAEVYERLGIATVSTVKWTVEQVFRHLIPLGPHFDWIEDDAGIAIVGIDLDPSWFGRSVSDLERATKARVTYLTRLGRGMLPAPSLVLQDGDALHMTVETDRAGAVQRIANHPAQEDL